jgi:hypothetical protein
MEMCYSEIRRVRGSEQSGGVHLCSLEGRANSESDNEGVLEG